VANGEDFVRQGFVSKDGWKIEFDKVAVTLAQVEAHQTEPPFDPHSQAALKPKASITLLPNQQTIDLAAGAADAAPILVATVPASPGGYNALSWQLVPGAETQQTITLQGKATKGKETVQFNLGFRQPLSYLCGEFVGDERKGFLKSGDRAEVETTFHFDHIFGDQNSPAQDALNQDALSFSPLAKLAKDGQLSLDETALAKQLSPQDYAKLPKAIASLGHVGEGHCRLQQP
jgi:hypothetical protein